MREKTFRAFEGAVVDVDAEGLNEERLHLVLELNVGELREGISCNPSYSSKIRKRHPKKE